ncbi:hypothetical protein, partial [Deinococcus aetherius]
MLRRSLLLSVLGASLLAGCSNSGTPSAQGPSSGAAPAAAAPSFDPWGQKPVLGFLLLTQDETLAAEVRDLFAVLGLSEAEREQLLNLAQREQEGEAALRAQYRRQAAEGQIAPQAVSQQNLQLQRVVDTTDAGVRALLGDRYDTFRAWVRAAWARQQARSSSADTGMVSPQAVSWPVLRVGSSGQSVTSLQHLLLAH